MTKRIFTQQDQDAFAKLSGDYNKLHIDEVAARRYLFGGLVVHGIHLLLWALDKWLEASEGSLELVSLKADFMKGLRVGDSVRSRLIMDEKDRAELELYEEDQVYASIKVKCKVRKVKTAEDLNFQSPPIKDCKVVPFEELAHASGELELYLEKGAAAVLFPNLVKRLPLIQIAEILAATRLVGMECPGFHSIFSGLDLNFNITKTSSRKFTYKVINYDQRFSLLVMEVKSATGQGTIRAFLRPPPTQQASFLDFLKIVPPDEFKEQKALIIGGSRGLGEVVAKLLAAGGAKIVLTYAKGEKDARRVADEIVSSGRRADVMRFNILTLQEVRVDEVAELSPTHMYYFATPYIKTNKKAFSSQLFREYCDYYVSGFSDSVELLLKYAPRLRKIFYASSIFVEDKPLPFAEYATAKAAGEAVCSFLEKKNKDIAIYKPRLPKMATDQTATIMAEKRIDPSEVMLQQLRNFKGYGR